MFRAWLGGVRPASERTSSSKNPRRKSAKSSATSTSTGPRPASRGDDRDRGLGDLSAYMSSGRKRTTTSSANESLPSSYVTAEPGVLESPPVIIERASKYTDDASRERARQDDRDSKQVRRRERDRLESPRYPAARRRDKDSKDSTRTQTRAVDGQFAMTSAEPELSQPAAQYDSGIPDALIPGRQPASQTGSSDHRIEQQFPGQFTSDHAEPYRPLNPAGEAADYYGDQGQSVWEQPGVRPKPPLIIPSSQAHLMPASPTANPPPEPSSLGQVGAAALYYAENVDAADSGVAPDSSSQPSNPSKPSALVSDYDPAPGAPTYGIGSNFGNFSAPGSTAPVPSSSHGIGSALGAAATEATAAYIMSSHHESSSGHENFVPYSTQNYEGPSQGNVGLGLSSVNLSNPNAAFPVHRPPGYGGQSGSTTFQQRRRGPLDKFIDFWRDREGVSMFEDYTETIGVCQDCFEPGTTSRDAPRKHHYRRRYSADRYSIGSRAGKSTRYPSSDNEARRKSWRNKSWITSMLAGYTAKSLFTNQDFDETYSAQSGRPDQSRYYSHDADIVSASDVRSNTSNGVYRRAEPPRRSQPSSCRNSALKDDALSAAVGMTAAAAVADSHHSSRNRSPRRRKSRKASSSESSFIEISRLNTASTGPTFESFFRAPSDSRRNRKSKKRRGFFSFSNHSSSSSDGDLAFGTGFFRKRKSTKSKKSRNAHDVDAALLGLGAAATALAEASRHRGRSPGEILAVRDRRRSDYASSASNDGEWEDAYSEDQSSSSISSALAFGDNGIYGRTDSSISNSGTSKRGWRWGSKKNKDKKNVPSPDAALAAGVGAAAAAGALADVALARKYAVPPSQDGSGSVGSLQHVFPVQTSDPSRFDAAKMSSSSSNSTQPPLVRLGPIPLQQPQPVTPVSQAVYTTQADSILAYSAPIAVADVLSGRDTESRNEFRNKRNSEYIQRNDVKFEVRSPRGKSDSTPVFPMAPFDDLPPTPKRRSTAKEQAIVQFDLTEEQEERERRADSRERNRRDSQHEEISPFFDQASFHPSKSRHEPQESDPVTYGDGQSNRAGYRQSDSVEKVIAIPGSVGAAATAAAVLADRFSQDSVTGSSERRHEELRKKRRAERRSASDATSELSSAVRQESGENGVDQGPIAEEPFTAPVKSSAFRFVTQTNQPTYENYADFFLPDELRRRPEDAVSDTSTRDQKSDILTIVETEPASEKREQVFDSDFGSHLPLPWPVPELRIIEPTPPHSWNGSVRDAASPVNQPDDLPPQTSQQADTERQTAGSHVSWGEDHTHVYEVPSPTSGLDSTIHADPAEDEDSIHKGEQSGHNEESLESEFADASFRERVSDDIPHKVPGSGGDDDLEFVATVAAAAAAAGFDPSIVTDDPTYLKRSSPPPGSETTVVFVGPSHSESGLRRDEPRGFVEGEADDHQEDDGANKKNAMGAESEIRALSSDEEVKELVNDAAEQQGPDVPAENRVIEDVPIYAEPKSIAVSNYAPATVKDAESSEVGAKPSVFADRIDAANAENGSDCREEGVAETVLENVVAPASVEASLGITADYLSNEKSHGRNDDASSPAGRRVRDSFAMPGGFDDGSVVDTEVPPDDGSSDNAQANDSGLVDCEIAERAQLENEGERIEDFDDNEESDAARKSNEEDGLESKKKRRRKRRSKLDLDLVDQDDVRSVATAIATVADDDRESEHRRHRRRSKRESSGRSVDEAASVTSSSARMEDSSGKRRSRDDPARKRSSGGFFSGLLGSMVSAPPEGGSKGSSSVDGRMLRDVQSDVGVDWADEYESRRRRRKRSSRHGSSSRAGVDGVGGSDEESSDVVGDDEIESYKSNSFRREERRRQRFEGIVQSGRDPLDEKDSSEQPESYYANHQQQPFLAESPETPFVSQNDTSHGASGLLPSSAVATLTGLGLGLGLDLAQQRPRSRSTTALATAKPVELAPKSQSRPASPDPDFGHVDTADRPALRTSFSPTAVPLHFRRPPPWPGVHRSVSGGVAAPESSPPAQQQQQRRPRPSSTEFKNSREFRPLWLVERFAATKADLVPDEPLPSLPSSKTTSRSTSVEDLRAGAVGDAGENSWERVDLSHVLLSDDGRRPPGLGLPMHYGSGGDIEVHHLDVLNSREATPTVERFGALSAAAGAPNVPRARKESLKYEFHSPSELLQDPAAYVELPPSPVLGMLPSLAGSTVGPMDEENRGPERCPAEDIDFASTPKQQPGSPVVSESGIATPTGEPSSRRLGPDGLTGVGVAGIVDAAVIAAVKARETRTTSEEDGEGGSTQVESAVFDDGDAIARDKAVGQTRDVSLMGMGEPESHPRDTLDTPDEAGRDEVEMVENIADVESTDLGSVGPRGEKFSFLVSPSRTAAAAEPTPSSREVEGRSKQEDQPANVNSPVVATKHQAEKTPIQLAEERIQGKEEGSSDLEQPVTTAEDQATVVQDSPPDPDEVARPVSEGRELVSRSEAAFDDDPISPFAVVGLTVGAQDHAVIDRSGPSSQDVLKSIVENPEPTVLEDEGHTIETDVGISGSLDLIRREAQQGEKQEALDFSQTVPASTTEREPEVLAAAAATALIAAEHALSGSRDDQSERAGLFFTPSLTQKDSKKNKKKKKGRAAVVEDEEIALQPNLEEKEQPPETSDTTGDNDDSRREQSDAIVDQDPDTELAEVSRPQPITFDEAEDNRQLFLDIRRPRGEPESVEKTGDVADIIDKEPREGTSTTDAMDPSSTESRQSEKDSPKQKTKSGTKKRKSVTWEDLSDSVATAEEILPVEAENELPEPVGAEQVDQVSVGRSAAIHVVERVESLDAGNSASATPETGKESASEQIKRDIEDSSALESRQVDIREEEEEIHKPILLGDDEPASAADCKTEQIHSTVPETVDAQLSGPHEGASSAADSDSAEPAESAPDSTALDSGQKSATDGSDMSFQPAPSKKKARNDKKKKRQSVSSWDDDQSASVAQDEQQQVPGLMTSQTGGDPDAPSLPANRDSELAVELRDPNVADAAVETLMEYIGEFQSMPSTSKKKAKKDRKKCKSIYLESEALQDAARDVSSSAPEAEMSPVLGEDLPEVGSTEAEQSARTADFVGPGATDENYVKAVMLENANRDEAEVDESTRQEESGEAKVEVENHTQQPFGENEEAVASASESAGLGPTALGELNVIDSFLIEEPPAVDQKASAIEENVEQTPGPVDQPVENRATGDLAYLTRGEIDEHEENSSAVLVESTAEDLPQDADVGGVPETNESNTVPQDLSGETAVFMSAKAKRKAKKEMKKRQSRGLESDGDSLRPASRPGDEELPAPSAEQEHPPPSTSPDEARDGENQSRNAELADASGNDMARGDETDNKQVDGQPPFLDESPASIDVAQPEQGSALDKTTAEHETQFSPIFVNETAGEESKPDVERAEGSTFPSDIQNDNYGFSIGDSGTPALDAQEESPAVEFEERLEPADYVKHALSELENKEERKDSRAEVLAVSTSNVTELTGEPKFTNQDAHETATNVDCVSSDNTAAPGEGQQCTESTEPQDEMSVSLDPFDVPRGSSQEDEVEPLDSETRVNESSFVYNQEQDAQAKPPERELEKADDLAVAEDLFRDASQAELPAPISRKLSKKERRKLKKQVDSEAAQPEPPLDSSGPAGTDMKKADDSVQETMPEPDSDAPGDEPGTSYETEREGEAEFHEGQFENTDDLATPQNLSKAVSQADVPAPVSRKLSKKEKRKLKQRLDLENTQPETSLGRLDAAGPVDNVNEADPGPEVEPELVSEAVGEEPVRSHEDDGEAEAKLAEGGEFETGDNLAAVEDLSKDVSQAEPTVPLSRKLSKKEKRKLKKRLDSDNTQLETRQNLLESAEAMTTDKTSADDAVRKSDPVSGFEAIEDQPATTYEEKREAEEALGEGVLEKCDDLRAVKDNFKEVAEAELTILFSRKLSKKEKRKSKKKLESEIEQSEPLLESVDAMDAANKVGSLTKLVPGLDSEGIGGQPGGSYEENREAKAARGEDDAGDLGVMEDLSKDVPQAESTLPFSRKLSKKEKRKLKKRANLEDEQLDVPLPSIEKPDSSVEMEQELVNQQREAEAKLEPTFFSRLSPGEMSVPPFSPEVEGEKRLEDVPSAELVQASEAAEKLSATNVIWEQDHTPGAHRSEDQNVKDSSQVDDDWPTIDWKHGKLDAIENPPVRAFSPRKVDTFEPPIAAFGESAVLDEIAEIAQAEELKEPTERARSPPAAITIGTSIPRDRGQKFQAQSKIANIFPNLERAYFRRPAPNSVENESSQQVPPPKDSAEEEPVESVTNRDSAIQVLEAPIVTGAEIRDSGYAFSPDEGFDQDESTSQRRLEPEAFRRVDSEPPADLSYDVSVSSDGPEAKTTSREIDWMEHPKNDVPPAEDDNIFYSASKFDSASKERSSVLFDSSPATRESVSTDHLQANSPSCSLRRAPSIHGRHHHPPTQWNLESISPQPKHGSIFGGPPGDTESISPPRTPLRTIQEQEPENRAETTTQEFRLTHSPSPSRKFTDNAFDRLSWPTEPGADERPEARDVRESQGLGGGLQSPSRWPADLLRTPGQGLHLLRPNSAGSTRSLPYGSAHSLRRSANRSASDLRAAKRQPPSRDKDLDKDLLSAVPQPPLPPPLEDLVASSSSYSVTDKGKRPIRQMTDVYEGWGETPQSPRSPSRPASVRRRQSMQHMQDLEARLDQLISENQLLTAAREEAEEKLRTSSLARRKSDRALNTRDADLRDKQAEVDQLKGSVEWLQKEIARLNEENENLTAAHASITAGHASELQAVRDDSLREVENLRSQHAELSAQMQDIVRHEVDNALVQKDAELQRLREDLDIAREKVKELQQQIAASVHGNVLVVYDEDYFENACQKLCGHVQQWVLRFSKHSDHRRCRSLSGLQDEKVADRFESAILDGSEADSYLGDRVRRRDVFMSVVMSMVWEYIFTRYLFGMDREQRQKLKSLEKQLSEVGTRSAIHRWRATTLTLLAKRPAFARQRESDTEAVVLEIFATLSALLPPPAPMESQLLESLRKVLRVAVDLSIQMRTQLAEYIMLPPLQPEYDTNGDLARKVYFNASLMNERSGETSSNEELEAREAVVRTVLFPLVVKKGNDLGDGDDEIVVFPAQVLVAQPRKDKTRMSAASGDEISLKRE